MSERYPHAIVQWEDFARGRAFHVLERYRRVIPSFNDDIQGTGAMAAAGLIRAAQQKGERLSDQVFVVVGNGAGGLGVAGMIREGLRREGLDDAAISERLFVVAKEGLLLESFGYEADSYQRAFIQPSRRVAQWANGGAAANPARDGAAQRGHRPAGPDRRGGPLQGRHRAGHAGTHAQAHYLDGGAIVAAGSPFAPIEYGGQTYRVGQGNNAFIFPGLGFGAVMSRAREITDGMVIEAAQTLADWTAQHAPEEAVFPPISRLREVSEAVAVRVARRAITEGVSAERRICNMTDDELALYIRAHQWTPEYLPYRRAPDAKTRQGL